MGLVWSAYGNGTSYAISLRPQPLIITAETGGETAHVDVSRTLLTEEIASADVRERGLYGRFFRPASGGPVPVLVLGGSDGGLAPYAMREAALLARHRFAALALPSSTWVRCPTGSRAFRWSTSGGAIRWLKDQASVRADRLGVIGTSRGGRLALLLGAHFPDLQAVVSYVGSGLVFPSPAGPEPAWTFRGKPLPGSPIPSISCRLIQSSSIRPRYRSSAPMVVLLISGDADQVWPSTQLSQVAMDRLGRYERPYRDEFRHYPNAGHGIPAALPSGHPRNLLLRRRSRRVTPPLTRIPGSACSECSMDVCGVLALGKPAAACELRTTFHVSALVAAERSALGAALVLSRIAAT